VNFSFIISTYKQVNLVKNCIEGIRKFHPESEIIVVDDGSSSNHVHNLRQIEGIELLTSFHNSGFGTNNNKGIYRAKGDIIILINNDVELTMPIEQELERIFNADQKIGIVGCLLFYPDGRVQHGGHRFINDRTDFFHYDHCVPFEQSDMAKKSRYNISVTGALMALRKSMVDHIGAFKKEYWFAYEDNELCLRAWTTGYRVYYSADISAIHHEGITRGVNQVQKQRTGTLKKELMTRQAFFNDIKLYDTKDIMRMVRKANGEKVPERPHRIGIVRQGALGDCIMLTGIIDEIKNRMPESEIYTCTACPYPFVANKSVIKNFAKFDTMVEQVDDVYLFDMVYEDSPKKPVWIAYADHAFGEGNYDPDRIKPRLQPFLQARQDMQKKLGENFRHKDKTCVIHAGSGFWSAKQWGRENYEAVVKELKGNGYTTILVGANADYDVAGVDIDFKNKLQLEHVLELIKMCDLFIGMDGGISHIAMCTSTPCVIMFTAADPQCFVHRWENTIAVVPNSECKFCRNQVVGSTGFPCWHGDNHCLKSIEVKDVMEAVKIMEGENGN
jgi:GT2 family glycosyltransferase/ADP-heptose:LPS heptosyltransferase